MRDSFIRSICENRTARERAGLEVPMINAKYSFGIRVSLTLKLRNSYRVVRSAKGAELYSLCWVLKFQVSPNCRPNKVPIAQIKTDTIWRPPLFLFLITAIGLGPTTAVAAAATTAAASPPAVWDATVWSQPELLLPAAAAAVVSSSTLPPSDVTHLNGGGSGGGGAGCKRDSLGRGEEETCHADRDRRKVGCRRCRPPRQPAAERNAANENAPGLAGLDDRRTAELNKRGGLVEQSERVVSWLFSVFCTLAAMRTPNPTPPLLATLPLS